MKVTIWGTRGSLPSPSPENNEFGGNTSCIQVSHEESFLILDAGSGIRRLSDAIPPNIKRIDILLTHLHMDHIMGLGFFGPLYDPKYEVYIWGPTSAESLTNRLTRYLSPPLFPVRLVDLPCQLKIMEVNHSTFKIGSLNVKTEFLCHPGPTVGYRITSPDSVLAYIPDHEPNLGSANFPDEPNWTSGIDIARNADLLFHDAQYTKEEYKPRVGWGHSAIKDTLAFARMAKVKHLLLFHHDPSHTDEQIKSYLHREMENEKFSFKVGIAAEGDCFNLPNGEITKNRV